MDNNYINDDNILNEYLGYYDDIPDDKEVVVWPDTQYLMEQPDFKQHCLLINDPVGLDMFGSSAYVVDKEWYNKL